MAHLGRTSDSIPQLIDEATSRDVENLAVATQLCDLVNSYTDGPKEAMKAIRKRMAIRSPSVIKQTMFILECLVKNCGMRFHIFVANRDFLNDVIRVVSPKNNPPEVQTLVLGQLQNWAIAFQGTPELKEVCKTYQDLKNKNVQFPPIDHDKSSQLIMDIKKSARNMSPGGLSTGGLTVGNQSRKNSLLGAVIGSKRPSLTPGDPGWSSTSATLCPTGRSRTPSPGFHRATLSPTGGGQRRANSREPEPFAHLTSATLSPIGSSGLAAVNSYSQYAVDISLPAPEINLDEVRSDIAKMRQNCKIFSALILSLTPGKESQSDRELLQDLNLQCQDMRCRVTLLLKLVDDDEVIGELQALNAELSNTSARYERLHGSAKEDSSDINKQLGQMSIGGGTKANVGVPAVEVTLNDSEMLD